MPETKPPTVDHVWAVLAWILVALAMFLAALVVVAGVAPIIAKATRPDTSITPGPDTIAPPPALVRPCDPIFQRCELPPCPTEDSENCVWDAEVQGNGQGRSFIRLGGVTRYLDGGAR